MSAHYLTYMNLRFRLIHFQASTPEEASAYAANGRLYVRSSI
jgi:hypothetical protein